MKRESAVFLTVQMLSGPMLVTALIAAAPARSAPANSGAVIGSGSKPMSSDEKVVQVLNRLSFGAKPGDFERVKAMGVKAYIAAQLNPQSIAENPIVDAQVASAEIIHQKSADLIKQFRLLAAQNKELRKMAESKDNPSQLDKSSDAVKEQQAMKQKHIKVVADQIFKTRLVRALESDRQLQEVMVDFWYNHFNISINKDLDHVLVGAYEEQAIRPNTLGRFRDILGATCYHPAMIYYLDNSQNAAAGSPVGPPNRSPGGPRKQAGINSPSPSLAANLGNQRPKKKGGLNENYARELMELHTLGVDGGYTQKDVIELARVLTGLSLPVRGYWGQFYPARHDQGEKIILGHKIVASGAGEVEEALDLLARHPSTAHHISFKLAQYFVADEPPKALVDRMAKRFSESDGDIKAVLSTMFESSEFFDGQYQNNKYKSPFRYAMSTLRASGARPQHYEPIYSFLKLQGQPLYACLTPDGYKNTKAAWLNSDALLKRINFATAVGSAGNNQANGPRAVGQNNFSYPRDYDQVLRTVNGGQLSSRTSAAIAKSPQPFKTALLLGSPEFMSY